MGVHGLWDIVGPSARPVRVEALRNKKLAVDASIWIYQFLKAVRDTEGNQLKNSHIVGFLRRICKLLYFGIKPVFVFDGGVPTLKKDTIRKRKEKREGNQESVEQIAQRILAKQLQLFAEGKLTRPKVSSSAATRREIPTEELYWDAYYDDQVDGNGTEPPKETEAAKEKESRMFRGQDDYDLPNHGPIQITEDDKRVMTGYEYDRLTKDISDDLDGVDLDNIDPQSKEFERLPLSTQYIVLSHLRLRSRLRMGYSKEQLQSLFPDPMEFSKFQIKMVQKRNFFTQKVMNVTGMDGDAKEDVVSRRIASDKNRAYDLKRTGDGYALSISKDSHEGDTSERPIFLGDIKEFVHADDNNIIELDDSDDDDIDWDDVEVMRDDKKENDRQESKHIVENPLFINDSDKSSDESDDESIEMEDVTPKYPTENNEPRADEDDEIMKKIKYLYEYSNTHNKGKGQKSAIDLSSDNDDSLDEYQEIQEKQIEEEELKQAIERSKQDYLNGLNEERNGSGMKSSLQNESPIILSNSALARTLKLPKLNMKDNLLFGRTTKQKVNKPLEDEDVHRKAEDSSMEQKKVLPLPDWFSKETSFAPVKSISANYNTSSRNLTEDEKAGLVSYGEIDNYISSEEEAEVINLDDVSENEKKVEGSNENTENNPVIITDEPANLSADSTASEHNFGLNAEPSDSEKVKNPVVDLSLAALKPDGKTTNVQEHENKAQFASNTEISGPSNAREEKVTERNPEAELEVNSSVDVTQEKLSGASHVNDLDENFPKPEDHHKNELQVNPKLTVSASDLISVEQKEPKPAQLDDDFQFSDEEEVNLLLDMEEENLAYDKFFSNIAGKQAANSNDDVMWTFTDEKKLQERLRKQKRDADEVSTKMIYDVQDLLARFGIPFITAPMEAEAQCAELELIGLVDGIITDDSDCFLFGGDRIYKNLFNEKNFVECYQDGDISEELGLTRYNMIELAILLGSDYTDGLKGIGKVTAMEILAEFKNLENFKQWWLDYQNGKIDESRDTPLRKKLRKSLGKNLFLGNDFPNKLIYEAYLHPEVDHDKTEFKWGYPDLDKLRTFLTFYVGWDRTKIDEILLPVIKSLNKPQSTIEEFFPVEMIQRRRQLEMSKRIKSATDKLKKGKSKQHHDGSQSKRQKI